MKGFAFDPIAKTLSFYRGGSETTLVVPDAFPVLLLPDVLELDDVDLDWPDVSKGRGYLHRWLTSIQSQWPFDDGYNVQRQEQGRIYISAKPQEWEQKTPLADAPDGADTFALLVRFDQTVAASHTWMGRTIPRMVIEDQWIPFTGSVLLEAELGFARKLSIYIDDNPASPTYRKLVAHQQQSVSTPPGGFGLHHASYGSPGGEPASIGSTGTSQGGETEHLDGAGWMVWTPATNSTPHYRSRSQSSTTGGLVPGQATFRDYRKTGPNPPTITDPTDYGSTWRIDLRGQFGRKS